jgi:hypothetical protein
VGAARPLVREAKSVMLERDIQQTYRYIDKDIDIDRYVWIMYIGGEPPAGTRCSSTAAA